MKASSGLSIQFGNVPFSTTTRYMAYDQPTTDWPVRIEHPGAAVTTIERDVFGKPASLTRGGEP